MYDERVYWLWLQHAFGAGSLKPISIYKRYNDLQKFYEGGRSLWSEFSFISEKNLMALEQYTLKHAQAQLEYTLKAEQEVVCFSDDEYPNKLRNIDTPPAVLYTKGELPDFDNILTITVVGSRSADEDAIKTTEELCYNLSKKGVIVVSGGAIGIDTSAHKGALKATGINVCVLPCGLDYPYLMQNAMMRNQIVYKGGCIISEYPINTCVYKGSFQVRNRIMSALCDGLLVVRAKKKSGTMITVSYATQQNKDVFAVPGNISDPNCEGTNLLIRDGAVPVLDVDDILSAYPYYNKTKLGFENLDEPKQRVDDSTLDGNSKIVYNSIGDEPVHISKLCDSTGLKTSQVQASITELEMLGYIKTYSGQRCSL